MKVLRMVILGCVLSMLAINPVVAQNWQISYGTDFSVDPGWTTNSPTELYWDAADETYYANQVNINYGGNYAYYDVGQADGSFLLEWDVFVSSSQYASGLTFGIFDPDLNTHTESYAKVDFGQNDQGQVIGLEWCGATQSPQSVFENSSQWSLDTWYHVAMEYTSDNGTLTAVVTERATGNLLCTLSASGIGPFDTGMTLIGNSNVRDGTYQVPGAQFYGKFDNVRFSIEQTTCAAEELVYSTDFSTDPEWDTENNARYYWDSPIQSYFADTYTNSGEYATTDISYSGESFRLSFDVMPKRPDGETGDVNIGIFGPTRISNSALSNTEERLYLMLGGYGSGDIYLTGHNSGNEHINSGPGSGLMLNHAWHHVEIVFDSETMDLAVDVTRNGSSVLSWQTTMGYGFTSNLSHIGVSAVGSWATSNRRGVAHIDNMTFCVTGSTVDPCALEDDFENESIDSDLWVYGGGARGTYPSDPLGTGPWTYSVNEIDDADGYVQLEVEGPTSSNTYGAEAWIRSKYDYNDGGNHLINFTLSMDALITGHYDYLYVQITDGHIADVGSLHWPDDIISNTVDLLLQENGDPPGPGRSYPQGLPKSEWSVTITSDGTAKLFDGADGTGTLMHEAVLEPSNAWHFRLMVIDGTSAGFSAGHDQLKLYDFAASCDVPSRLYLTPLVLKACDSDFVEQPIAIENNALLKGANVAFKIPEGVRDLEVSFEGYITESLSFNGFDVNYDSGFVIIWIAGGDIPVGDNELFGLRYKVERECRSNTTITWDTALSADPDRMTFLVGEDFEPIIPQIDSLLNYSEILGYEPGDVNDDGKVNLADITLMIDHVYISKAPLCLRNAGSVTSDCRVNLADITKVIDGVYGSKDTLPCGCWNPSPLAKQADDVSVNYSFCNGQTTISVNTLSEIRGLHIELVGPDGAVPVSVEPARLDVVFGQDDESVSIGVFDTDGGEMIRAGDNTVLTMAGEYEIVAAQVVTQDFDVVEPLINSKSLNALPGSFALYQNYPNPFNPITTIQFDLPIASDYKMTIYNITGQVVDQKSGHSEPGTVSLEWDAAARASGIYFYRLQAGELVETKKMILLK